MANFFEDRDRNVIPRLRSFKTTLALGELDPTILPNADLERIEGADASLASKIRDWNENRSVSFASDLVSAAFVLHRPEAAKDAAQFLLETASTVPKPAVEIAAKILQGPAFNGRHSEIPAVNLPHVTDISQRIHSKRRQLVDEPRNSILWVELARAYAYLGVLKKAEHAMDVAVQLGPTNRFILRSASRLYIHVGKLSKAHRILGRAESTKYDPWLLSAEIAAASAATRNSQFVRIGQRMLHDESLSAFEKNELASAIGTLELSHGKVKAGRNLFRQALLDPTENSVAQVGWALRQRHLDSLGFDLERTKIETPRSFEARAWGHFTKLNWKNALHASFDWVRDQPFSTRPIIFASFVAAALLEDYRSCERVIEIGLRANPKEPTLLNDLAFSYASSGQIDKAENAFAKIDATEIKGVTQEIAITATQGLLNFRRGFVEAGRSFYELAIEMATKNRQRRSRAMASIYLAREEVLANSREARKAVERAVRERDRVRDEDIKQIFDNALGSYDLHQSPSEQRQE